jgi:hypothetical protein
VPPFPRPSFPYDYSLADEVAALRRYRDTRKERQVPRRRRDRLLLATWNIANLGLHERHAQDYALIAELIRWFELVAIQEVNDDLRGLRAVLAHLPKHYRALFSDAGGNRERLAFVYDTRKLSLLEKIGEVAIPPSEARHVRLPNTAQTFTGFDRNPYLAAFRAGSLTFLLVAVHLYFGGGKNAATSKRDMNRRSLETYAVARWADLRRRSRHAYTRDIFALGDFNLPKAQPGDPVYDALTARGLQLPEHSNKIGSSLRKDVAYDQIAFFPTPTGEPVLTASSVFDWDGALFADLWRTRGANDFFSFARHAVSDHRILWAQLRI